MCERPGLNAFKYLGGGGINWEENNVLSNSSKSKFKEWKKLYLFLYLSWEFGGAPPPLNTPLYEVVAAGR